MIHLERPADFNPRFEVVSCVLEHNGSFLLLHRHAHKPQGNTWGLPGGKAEPEEDIQTAIAREVFEETGYVASPEVFIHSHELLVTHDGYDFVYHVFGHTLSNPYEVQVEEAAHQGYRWVSLEEALELPLMPDEDQSILQFYRTREA
ncbi:MAG: pyrophosphohydrolase [Parcubacteria bacterium C7867-008]|nr:MAG: pyrophosphohydrolase [Parcubacteria bacterium C7867-008]